ncbi:MAG TPA: hypothetical protein VFU68_07490 [Terracidiphilus sp.]|nr:hypothetical protein [Terracidiphilus sp.]
MKKTMKDLTKTPCVGMEAKLAELLLDEATAPAAVKTHVAECAGCRTELDALRATMTLMDAWEAPEPGAYFMTRMNARLEEAYRAPREGWFARLRDRVVFGPAMHVKPLAAMALTALLLVGGGAYLDMTNWVKPAQANGQAAVVHDLQTLENNAQLLDQLESISDDSGTSSPSAN